MRVASLLAACVVTALAACAPMKVRSNYDPAASFADLRTYDWRSGPELRLGDPRIDNRRLDALVRGAMERELAAKGYEKRSSGPPDFLVGYHAVLDTMASDRTINTSYGYSRGWGSGYAQTFTSTYEQGTLMLDIVDPETMKLLWRGSVEAVVDFHASPEKRARRINQAVKRALRKFPP